MGGTNRDIRYYDPRTHLWALTRIAELEGKLAETQAVLKAIHDNPLGNVEELQAELEAAERDELRAELIERLRRAEARIENYQQALREERDGQKTEAANAWAEFHRVQGLREAAEAKLTEWEWVLHKYYDHMDDCQGMQSKPFDEWLSHEIKNIRKDHPSYHREAPKE